MFFFGAEMPTKKGIADKVWTLKAEILTLNDEIWTLKVLKNPFLEMITPS